jgi:hypothetical protein
LIPSASSSDANTAAAQTQHQQAGKALDADQRRFGKEVTATNEKLGHARETIGG